MKALAIALVLSLAAGLAGAEVNTVTHVLVPDSEALLRAANGSASSRTYDPGSWETLSVHHRVDGTSPPVKLYLSFAEDFSQLINDGYMLSTASLRLRLNASESFDGNGTYVGEPLWLDVATVDPLEGVAHVTADVLPAEAPFASLGDTGAFQFSVPSDIDITRPMNFALTVDLAAHLPTPTSPEEERYFNFEIQCLDDSSSEMLDNSEDEAPWLVLTFTKPAVKTTEAATWGEVKALYQ